MTQYNYDDIVSYATACVRRFKPLVCVSQDFNGEYGHGGHCIYAKAVSEAVNSSAEASFNPDSASEYGITKTLSLLMLIHLLAGSTKERLLIY